MGGKKLIVIALASQGHSQPAWPRHAATMRCSGR